MTKFCKTANGPASFKCDVYDTADVESMESTRRRNAFADCCCKRQPNMQICTYCDIQSSTVV